MKERIIPVVICLSLVFIGLISFLVFMIKSTKTNNKIDNIINGFYSKTYKIKYYKLKDKVEIYGKENSQVFSYNTVSFLDLFQKEKINEFNDWINNCDNDSKNFICNIKDLKDENKWRLVVFSIKDIKDDVLNIICRLIDNNVAKNYASLDSVIMKESDLLKNLSTNNQNLKLSNISYFIICINANLYDYIERRYGNGVADSYVKYVYSLIEDHKLNHSLLTHYKKDAFLVILPLLRNRLSISIIVKKMLDYLNKIAYIDMYQFELKPTIGISTFSFSKKDFETKAEYAYRSSLEATGNSYKFYDNTMRKKVEEEKKKKNELISVMNNLNRYGYYYPIVSLNNGNTVGYLEFIRYSSENFEFGNELYNFAINNSLKDIYEEKLFYGSVETFKNFTHKKSNNAMIIINSDSLNSFIDYYEKIKDEIKFNLILILKDYKNLSANFTNYRSLLSKAKKLGISLGIVLDESMSTTLTKYFSIFSWLLIDNITTNNVLNNKDTEWMIENIIDITTPYNLKVLAYNIQDIKIAEVLKEIGVEYIEGPLLDKRNEDYVSIRSLDKLIDEREDE